MNLTLKYLEYILAVALAAILALLPVHAFLSTWLGTSIGPLLLWKSWKEILLALLAPLVVYYCLRRPEIARTLWRRRVNQVIAAYVVLHVVLALLLTDDTAAALAGLMMNLRFLAIFILAQIVAASGDSLGNPWVARLKAHAAPWLLGVMAGLALLAILQVTVLPADFLTHFGYNRDATIAPAILIDQNPEALRAFATMRGPNTLGAYLLLPLALAMALVAGWRGGGLAGWWWAGLITPGPQRAQRLLTAGTVALGFIALALTGSRSAWIGCAVMLTVLPLLSIPKSRIIINLRRFGLPLLVLAMLGAWAAISIPSLRLAVFHSSPGDTSLLEGSTELHWRATLSGLTLAAQHPFGMGPGNSGPATYYRHSGVNLPEDYFVQIWQEVGLPGLALFAAICWLTAARLYQLRTQLWPRVLLASFAGLSVINLFLHGWADDPTAMTWWGLAGLFAFGASGQQTYDPHREPRL